MIAAPIHLAGERLMLDPGGGLYWPAQEVLAVADLHLEKGSAAAANGSLLPPWDSATTLERLTLLLRRWRPRVLVALGDTFHDGGGADRLGRVEKNRLAALARGTEFVWVLGNHDPLPPQGIAGAATEQFRLGPLVFRHRAVMTEQGELFGHFHPKAHVPVRGTVITRPCFVCDGRRLLLPALGAYAGGLDVRDAAITALFPRGGRVFVLGRERLFSFRLGVVGAVAP
jgi:DNA ligase-associated metallophosphoesterase